MRECERIPVRTACSTQCLFITCIFTHDGATTSRRANCVCSGGEKVERDGCSCTGNMPGNAPSTKDATVLGGALSTNMASVGARKNSKKDRRTTSNREQHRRRAWCWQRSAHAPQYLSVFPNPLSICSPSSCSCSFELVQRIAWYHRCVQHGQKGWDKRQTC